MTFFYIFGIFGKICAASGLTLAAKHSLPSFDSVLTGEGAAYSPWERMSMYEDTVTRVMEVIARLREEDQDSPS